MIPEIPETQANQNDRYLDFMRDIIKISIYKCSCGFRAYGLPVSAHELAFKSHGMMIREESPITHAIAIAKQEKVNQND